MSGRVLVRVKFVVAVALVGSDFNGVDSIKFDLETDSFEEFDFEFEYSLVTEEEELESGLKLDVVLKTEFGLREDFELLVEGLEDFDLAFVLVLE